MAIDKAKGIICKPMPRTWHDRYAAGKIEDENLRDFYRSIVADKKPYFMRYIYPSLMKQYNTYIKNTERKALREFQMTVSEMKKLPYEELSEEQREFLRYYDYMMPVGVGNCVMNKICRRFEQEFDGYVRKRNTATTFDYTIMKSDAKYTPSQFNTVKKLYEEYNRRIQSYVAFSRRERVDKNELQAEIDMVNETFQRECNMACPDKRVLCNIVLDLCYKRNSTKRFAWKMCGEEIIHNLLEKNGHIISFPVIDGNGDIEYGGERFSLTSKMIGGC